MIRLSNTHYALVKRYARNAALSFLAAQATAIATVVLIDEHRKRRSPQSGKFPRMAPRKTSVSTSDVTVYTYGEDLYEAQLEAIDNAQNHIYFETFIWKNDEVGQRFRRALINAARRGVKVHIIVDTWGNLTESPKFRRFPAIACLHAIRFPLIRPGIITGDARRKGRDHRKILCVDGQVGFVGGYNIGQLYAKKWRDTHVRITGEQVWELENAFVDMWNLYRNRKKQPSLPDTGAPTWAPTLRSIENTPAFNSYPIRAAYLDAINHASHKVWITMGYFIPDAGLRAALKAAAGRGVDVRILIPQYSNHIVADWVGRPQYQDLLEAGVRIFLFEEAMVHAKTMTVDGIWSTVGTANIDRLSMKGNFEINLEVFDDHLAAKMEEVFRIDLTNAHELTLAKWQQRSALARLGERILGPLGPLL
ncbi:MAG: phospholipase D-like domain-containing protein [Actinomycetaceae bacterium]|nr:phospholipase D-like domain-containing protein [Arcanobacterium sp.]MDD7505620.1 phospholipase D-like domain-containing protein [Actinomycetaceae bacterium]MDY6143398.1 phospholipase D-like domain-containing protein [Arcanobacterium sp.]